MVAILLDERKGSQTGGIRVVAPRAMQKRLLKEGHDAVLAGHGGIFKTGARIRQLYWWPRMMEDIKEHVRQCRVCKRCSNKGTTRPPPLRPIAAPEGPNCRIHVDLFGPLTGEDGRPKYVCVITDAFSKLVKLEVITSKDAETVAEAIVKGWIFVHGVPKQIITDQGREFVNKFQRQLWSMLGVNHNTTSAYHPEANGQAEIFNKTMKAFLTKMLAQAQESTVHWEKYVGPLMFSHNTAIHKAIMATPFYTMFGYDPRVPLWEEGDVVARALLEEAEAGMDNPIARLRETQLAARRWAAEQNEKERLNYKAQHDKRNKVQVPEYQPDQKVWVRIHQTSDTNRKLSHQWEEAIILKQVSPESFRVIRPGRSRKKTTTMHARDIKPSAATDSEEDMADTSDTESVDSEEEREREQMAQPQQEREYAGPITRARTRQLAERVSGVMARALREPMSFAWTCENLRKAVEEAERSKEGILFLPGTDMLSPMPVEQPEPVMSQPHLMTSSRKDQLTEGAAQQRKPAVKRSLTMAEREARRLANFNQPGTQEQQPLPDRRLSKRTRRLITEIDTVAGALRVHDVGPTGLVSFALLWLVPRAATQHDIYFRHRGQTVSTLGYVHVHIYLNMSTPVRHLQEVQNELETIQMAYSTRKGSWVPLAMKMLARGLGRVRRQIVSIHRAAGGAPSGTARHKRFTELLGLAGTFMGILNTIQIAQLQKQLTNSNKAQGITIHRVEANSLTLKDHEHRLQEMKRWMVEEADLTRNMARDEAMSHMAMAMTIAAEQEGEELLAILASLMQHRLHPTLLTEEGLQTTWTDVKQKAAAMGYVPVAEHQTDLLQCETSFKATEEGFEIFVHIPIARQGDRMEVFEYIPVPLKASAGSVFQLRPQEEVIAWAEDKQAFRTMTTAALSTCTKLGNMFLCDDNTEMKQVQNKESCIVNLYLRRYEDVRRTCRMSVEPLRNGVVEITGGHFVFFNEKDHRGRITCPTDNSSMPRWFNADKVAHVHLEAGCQAETEGARATAVLDLSLDLPGYSYPFPEGESPSSLLEGIDLTAWEKARTVARALPEGHTIEDIAALQEAERLVRETGLTQWGLAAVIATLCGVGVFIGGRLLWKRGRQEPARRSATRTGATARTPEEGCGPAEGSIFR